MDFNKETMFANGGAASTASAAFSSQLGRDTTPVPVPPEPDRDHATGNVSLQTGEASKSASPWYQGLADGIGKSIAEDGRLLPKTVLAITIPLAIAFTASAIAICFLVLKYQPAYDPDVSESPVYDEPEPPDYGPPDPQ